MKEKVPLELEIECIVVRAKPESMNQDPNMEMSFLWIDKGRNGL